MNSCSAAEISSSLSTARCASAVVVRRAGEDQQMLVSSYYEQGRTAHPLERRQLPFRRSARDPAIACKATPNRRRLKQ